MSWIRWALGAVLLAASALVIAALARGAQRRRFLKAYGSAPHAGWSPEDTPFLAAVAEAFRLPEGWAYALPPEATPMALYLTLYPEHSIYDELELERLLQLFPPSAGRPEALLDCSWRELADRWRALHP